MRKIISKNGCFYYLFFKGLLICKTRTKQTQRKSKGKGGISDEAKAKQANKAKQA